MENFDTSSKSKVILILSHFHSSTLFLKLEEIIFYEQVSTQERADRIERIEVVKGH